MRSSFSLSLLYHAYVYLEFLILACTIYILAPGRPLPQLTMEGYRPDVFFEYNGVMFIGEAKTSDDILREHSINQYYSYLKKCSLNQGHATFVLAVPLEDRARANNILGKIKKEIPGDYEVKAIGMIV